MFMGGVCAERLKQHWCDQVAA